ncbi:MAG TPA: ABC transporter substrate binding protein, partial [Burkholderiales bacterium]|nr:ABC transporter substrate binding protein [Burkholderiales bacterium]
MKRRQIFVALGVLVAARLVGAQTSERMRRIGWLSPGSPASHAKYLEAFREGLKAHGWLEGRSIALELRWAEGYLDRLPLLAAELVALKPDVIVTASNVVHLAAHKATSTIPIVMATGADPVAAGLAASFAHP